MDCPASEISSAPRISASREPYLRTRIRLMSDATLWKQFPEGMEYDYSVPTVQRIAYANKLFMIERDIRSCHLTADEIKERRLQKEKPVLEGLWSWLEKQNPEKRTRFDKAVTNICNRRDLLENYILDGCCRFSNNASERSVNQVVIGRKTGCSRLFFLMLRRVP